MGHVHVAVGVRGGKGEFRVEKMLVDTGATYTTLRPEILEKIGAVKTPYTVALKLEDGRTVEAKVYVAEVKVGDREGPALIAAFKDAKTILSVQALEALGFKVNSTTGELEAIRT